jgi:2'-5' RNA ligase
MPRLFVAIDLPEELRGQVSSLYYGIPKTRWTPPEQLHLTLRFIGEVDGQLFRQIVDQLETVKFDQFSLQFNGLGYFPPRRHPNILWVGVNKNEALTQLQRRLETCLVKLGLEPEHRKFHPHLTIARLAPVTSLGKLADYLALNGAFTLPAFTVRDFRLYSSHLTRQGADHQLEAKFPSP